MLSSKEAYAFLAVNPLEIIRDLSGDAGDAEIDQ
jgi:hypothetical protein